MTVLGIVSIPVSLVLFGLAVRGVELLSCWIKAFFRAEEKVLQQDVAILQKLCASEREKK